jgi:hypothetical protein
MKKEFSVLVAMLMILGFVCVPAFALLDDHSVNGEQYQGQVGINDNENNLANFGVNSSDVDNRNSNVGVNENDVNNRNSNENDNRDTNINDVSNRNANANYSDNDNKNTNLGINDQGQQQGQGQGQTSVGKVNVEDNSSQEYKAYSFAPPAINAQKGTSTANMYSIFGGIGLSQTEEYTITIEKLSVIERLEALGYMTKEEAKSEANKLYAELQEETKPKRMLGILWKTRGRNILNGFGMLACDSLLPEGKKKTIDTKEVTVGNEGNL